MILISAGSIGDTSNLELNGPRGIAIFQHDGANYAAVTGILDNGIQILNLTDPANPAAAGSIPDTSLPYLCRPYSIAIFQHDGANYAAAGCDSNNNVQILNLTDPANPAAAGSIRDTSRLKLDNPRGIAIFQHDGANYAAVTGHPDDGVQILNLTDPANPAAAGSIGDTASLSLRRPYGIAIFQHDGANYAAVTGILDHGIQILNLTDPANPAAAGSIGDTASLSLRRPYSIAIFQHDGANYAAVTGYSDDGVQILNLNDPANPAAAGSILDAPSLKLDDPRGIAIFQHDGANYAAVTGYSDDGVQMLNLTDPANPAAAGSISDTASLSLGRPYGIAIFQHDGANYAAVTSVTDNGVQILMVDTVTNSPPTADAGPDQAVREGAAVALDGAASDPDGDDLTYLWTHNSTLPIALANVTALDTTFIAPSVSANSTVQFTLTATDHHNASATDTMLVTVADVTDQLHPDDGPVLRMIGDRTTTVVQGSTWTDPGATCVTFLDGTPLPVTVTGVPVDTDTAGTYRIEYSCFHNGKVAHAFRAVEVVSSNEPPVIDIACVRTAIGPEDTATDFSCDAICRDREDGNLLVTSSVTYDRGGRTATITYSCTDSGGRTATTSQEVVVLISSPPEIYLNPPAIHYMNAGDPWTDPGAYCVDAEDGTFDAETVHDGVDPSAPGHYKVIYACTDSDGNAESTVRNILVQAAHQNLPPVLSISDYGKITVPVNGTWSIPSATCHDREDGDLTDHIWMYGVDEVDVTRPGVYDVFYFCTDSDDEQVQAHIKVRVAEP